ncbi:MAG: hypothetical protein RI958_1145 [Actinomycetota bacterium]|jgi:5'-nucleotidase
MRILRRRPAALLGLAAVAAASVSVSVPVGSVGAEPIVEVTVLGINDFHGRIDSNTTKWATTIEQARADAVGGPDAVALISAGDNIGATLFASSIFDDSPTIDVLNTMALDVSTVGNHELDKGYDTFVDWYVNGSNPAVSPALFTYVAANVYDSTTGDPVLPEYEIVNLVAAGDVAVRLGVIGAITVETPTLVAGSGVANLDFGDPVAAVNRVAAQLTDGDEANGEADVLVASYHDGGGLAAPDATLDEMIADSPVFDSIVNGTTASVSAIFTAHTHRAYAFQAPVPGAPGETRAVIQTGSYGERIGKAVLSVDMGAAPRPVVTASIGENIARAASASLPTVFPRVDLVDEIVTATLADAAIIGDEAIGSVAADITTAFLGGTFDGGIYAGGTRDDRSRESSLGNLVADAMLWSLADPARGGAEITVMNPGGLRSELYRAPDTVVTVAEANAVLPFANTLDTIDLTGAQFKQLLEEQWQRAAPGGPTPSRPRLWLGVSSNVQFTYDETRALDDRITSVRVDGFPLDLERVYRVGANSFLVDGGDNFRAFRDGVDRRDSGLIDSAAWIEYIKENAPLVPDYARRSAVLSDAPSVLVSGDRIQLSVSELDMRSLGAPANEQLFVFVDDVLIGGEGVVDGGATVDLALPALAAGPATVRLVAAPSGTVIDFPVTVFDTLTPVNPGRVFDTRAGESPDALRSVPKSKVGPTNVLQVQMTDLASLVPADGVAAVSLNVVATGSSAGGFITVYPCGDRKEVSSVNFSAGATVANAVIAPVSDTGKVCFYANTPVDVVVDVNGWYATGSAFNAVSPERLFDTRDGESPDALRAVDKVQVSPAQVLEVDVLDLAGVTPGADVGAVSLNVVATGSRSSGFLTVYPCGERKLVSSVNFTAGATVANAVIVPVSATGTVCFYANTAVDVVADINGWFVAGSSFRAVGPDRLFDTRAGESPDARRNVPKVQVGGGYVLEVKVTNITDLVPADEVGAVSMNVVATNARAGGFVTVYPCGVRGEVSSVNFAPGQTVANAVTSALSADGTVCFYSNTPVDIVADINGWFVG